MATPSLQVCMETSDWLKGLVSDAAAAASTDNSGSSSPSVAVAAELLARPADRRLRPPHDGPLKCPRCDSAHTKFCYYNNYSLSQPRYFCKTCRRYWTKGGSLRNVPVGGGCRKNKRPAAARKPNPLESQLPINSLPAVDLQLSNLNFMFDDGSASGGLLASNYAPSPYAMNYIDLDHNPFVEACQRLALPYEAAQEEDACGGMIDVKPGNRMLSLEWADQGCGDPYGLWAGGMIGGYGHGHGPSSAAM